MISHKEPKSADVQWDFMGFNLRPAYICFNLLALDLN